MLRNNCTILRLLQDKAATEHGLFKLRVTLQVICQTREIVLDNIPKHRKQSYKYDK